MFNELAKEVHQIAVEKGWWESGDRNTGEIIALIHSELSEALEAYRNGEKDYWKQNNGKPEGMVAELADVIIRILDFAGRKGFDLDTAIKEKIEYNKSRPYRHGGKVA